MQKGLFFTLCAVRDFVVIYFEPARKNPSLDARPVIDPIDALGMAWFLGLFFGLPLLGWLAMALDYRAYLRSFRRALVVLRQYRLESPLWALRDRPVCLQELGLNHDCTREEVMAAYRERVKRVHPDHGGDRQRFDQLQQRLHEALTLVEAREA